MMIPTARLRYTCYLSLLLFCTVSALLCSSTSRTIPVRELPVANRSVPRGDRAPTLDSNGDTRNPVPSEREYAVPQVDPRKNWPPGKLPTCDSGKLLVRILRAGNSATTTLLIMNACTGEVHQTITLGPDKCTLDLENLPVGPIVVLSVPDEMDILPTAVSTLVDAWNTAVADVSLIQAPIQYYESGTECDNESRSEIVVIYDLGIAGKVDLREPLASYSIRSSGRRFWRFSSNGILERRVLSSRTQIMGLPTVGGSCRRIEIRPLEATEK